VYIVCDLVLIDQRIGSNRSPLDILVVLTDVDTQIIGCFLVVCVWWCKIPNAPDDDSVCQGDRFGQIPVAVSGCVHEDELIE